MEAVFFRFLAGEMAQALTGARVDKIYLPSPNCLTVSLQAPRPVPVGEALLRKPYLHVRYGSGRFFCFLSALKTVQPDRAPAEAMRLRKHLRGRRLERLLADWPRRRLTLVPAGPGPALLLDPGRFPQLVEPPLPEPDPPVWPDLEALRREPDVWRAHPQCSPQLRQRLAALPEDAARDVYHRLQAEHAEGFFLEWGEGGPQAIWPVAWPARLIRGREVRAFASALAAAAAFGEPLAFAEVSGRNDAPERTAQAAAARRLGRALARLEADEARMRALIARRAQADLLAAHLHQLDKLAKTASLTLVGPEGEPVAVRLDPSLTVVGNMQKLYDLGAKGERGLAAIAARRQDLQDGKKVLKGPGRLKATARDRRPGPTGPAVAAFAYRTADGFLALRGRNAKANDQLLRQASPFDFWLHVADGPGAHVIVRRDHPGREVPRRSLEQAAGLAVMASYAAGAGAADVLVALVADVRRVKGAAAGRVNVTEVVCTIRGVASPELETLRETS